MAVMMVLDKWRGYLLDRDFKIKTDHSSLKYLLDQRLTTPFQAKWLPKLLGCDYEIEYKKGSDNKATDALSRVVNVAEMFSLIANVTSDIMVQIEHNWFIETTMKDLVKKVKLQKQVGKFELVNE